MPIFEPFLLDEGESNGAVALRLSVLGFDGAGPGSSLGGVTLTLGVVGEDEGGGEIVIVVPDYGSTVLYLGAAGGDVSHSFDDGATSLGLSVLGFDSADPASESVGGATLALRALGYEFAPPTAYGFLVEQPSYMFGYGGVVFETVEDTLLFSEVTSDTVTLVLQSLVELDDAPAWVQHLLMTLESSLTARAVFDVILEASFTDTLNLTDTPTAALRAIINLADQLVLTGEVEGFENALLTVVSALVLRDAVVPGQDMPISSTLTLAEVVSHAVSGMLELVSEIELADESSGNATISLLLSDAFTVADGATTTLAGLVELMDEVGFTVRFSLPGNDSDLYVGYAMNLRNAGMVKYENWPFTEMATVGGVPLAIGEEGLYRLEGDTDDGLPIRARIRTGLTDFGTAMLKHTLNSYVGYTTDGQLVMKVTTTDGGRKRERWYALKPREAGAPMPGRFDIAKGLVGLYWGYELVNVDGADFEFDTVKVWPFAVQRRKSGR